MLRHNKSLAVQLALHFEYQMYDQYCKEINSRQLAKACEAMNIQTKMPRDAASLRHVAMLKTCRF